MKDREKFNKKLFMEWFIVKTLFIAIVSAISIHKGFNLLLIVSVLVIDFIRTVDLMKELRQFDITNHGSRN